MTTDYLDRLFSLAGRVAVVTGGSSGIGRGISMALAGAGARVVLIARGADALAGTAASIRAAGGEAGWVSADLGSRAELERGAEAAAAVFGEPDILVCAAGVNLRPPMDALTTAEWDQTIAVNLTAPFLLGQRFGPAMAARGWGRIINISSINAHIAREANANYCAAKAGLEGMTRALAVEWGAKGVTVNAIAPGYMMSPDNMATPLRADPTTREWFAQRTALKRWGQADELDGAVVYLASNASAYCTGHVLIVDGGMSVKI